MVVLEACREHRVRVLTDSTRETRIVKQMGFSLQLTKLTPVHPEGWSGCCRPGDLLLICGVSPHPNPLRLNIASQLRDLSHDRDPMYFAKELAVVLVANPSSPGPYPGHCVSIRRATPLEEVTGALQRTYTLQGSVDAATTKALL